MSADFDKFLSMTVTHACENERIETSVSGISFYISREGVAILTLIEDIFTGECSACNELIRFTKGELKERL